MDTIYRVEHVEIGAGPYRADTYAPSYELRQTLKKFCREITDAHQYDSKRPVPCWGVAFGAGSRRFGFRTREAMNAWFDGWWEELKAHDFVVREYLGEILEDDGRQVLFQPYRRVT